jgi:hypothetical protein
MEILLLSIGVSAELATACRARAACDGFGSVRNTTATAFDVFYRFQVTNFQVANFPLLNSTPNRTHYMYVWSLVLHCQVFRRDVRFGMFD